MIGLLVAFLAATLLWPTETGTLLFSVLESVDILDESSRWRTPDSITIGTDLRTVERFNGRPFKLQGFGVDFEGTVRSWSGGRLASQDSRSCWVNMRFGQPDSAPDKLIEAVTGDGTFSSDRESS